MDDMEAIVSQRYGFIQGALMETYTRGENEQLKLSQRIDKLLTHKYLRLLVFFAIVWFIFFATFKLGEYPMNGIDYMVGALGQGVGSAIPDGIVNNLMVDGIIGGVGEEIIFLPNIMILFFLISVRETLLKNIQGNPKIKEKEVKSNRSERTD
jgi:ferrous iron transport protein B